MLERGIDVRECFGPADIRDRDWRTIWALKDRLPYGSQYRSALSTDPDLAEQILDSESDAGDSADTQSKSEGPRPEGYTIDSYLLLSVIDALQGVQAAVIAAAGGEPPKLTPMPRPVTAVEQARGTRRDRSMQALIDLFTPPAPPAGESAVEPPSAET